MEILMFLAALITFFSFVFKLFSWEKKASTPDCLELLQEQLFTILEF